MRKSFLAVFLALCLMLSLLPGTALAAEVVASGECGADGDNLTWELSSDGTLTINGTGDINNWYSNSPWYQDKRIKRIVVGTGVTSVGQHSFDSCENLTSVELPNSMTLIRRYAFSGCINLTSIAIPSGVTALLENAFSDCINLISMELPDSVTIIGSRVFDACNNLEDIYYSGTMEQWNAITIYAGNSPLLTTTIHCTDGDINAKEESDIIASGECGAQGDNLKWVLTSNGVLTISGTGEIVDFDYVDIPIEGTDAFTPMPLTPWKDNLSAIEKIVVEKGVTSIGAWAFAHCENTTDIVIPNGVTSIGNSAFLDCDAITNLTLPASVTFIDRSAFINCSKLEGISLPANLNIISGYMLAECQRLTSVIISQAVSTIERRAFYYSDNLSDVYYSGTKAQWNAITVGEENNPLLNATIHCTDGDINPKDDNIIASGECGAQGDNLTWVLTKDGTLTISGTGEMADWDYGEQPFNAHRYQIHRVIIEDGVTSIGQTAFVACNNLSSVIMPKSVTVIGDVAFSHCDKLTRVIIPNNVTSIGDGAFSGCVNLVNIEIPDSVTFIGVVAFAQCESLISIAIPNSVIDIESGVFENCTSLTSVTISNSVTSITSSMFQNCTNLNSIVIPNGVVSIGPYAFDGCTNLTNVTIPKSVTSIAWNVFRDCVGLSDVYYLSSKAQWDKIMVNDNNEPLFNANIHFLDEDDAKVLPESVMFVPYQSAIEEGAETAVVYELSEGDRLPRGLELDAATGEITGAPLESGTFRFHVSRLDGNYTQELFFELTVQNNTNAAVQQPNDYDIIENVGIQDPRDPNSFYMTEYREETLAINGPYQEFYRLLIDGKERIRDVDYTVREGSTIITIRSQTFRSVGEGTHTIAAEFRGTDSNGKTTMKQVAQNYTLTIDKPNNGNTGSNTSSSSGFDSSNSNSTNYSITVPKIPNCTVKVTPSSASAGTRVTLTVKPYTGYLLDSVTVTGPNGDQIALTKTGDGKYTFRMPSGKVDISVQVSAEKPAPVPAGDTPFTDMAETDWFYSSVRMAYQRGWMVGVSADAFAPHAETSRGMIVSVLHRIAGQPAPSNTYFTDVPLNQYYTTAAAWAADQGIITGYGDGRFGPSDSLTREQIVMILYNYASKTGMDTTARSELNQLTDLDQLSKEAQTAMSWAHAVGLVNGVGNGVLNPVGTATRAEMAAFLVRFITLAENH